MAERVVGTDAAGGIDGVPTDEDGPAADCHRWLRAGLAGDRERRPGTVEPTQADAALGLDGQPGPPEIVDRKARLPLRLRVVDARRPDWAVGRKVLPVEVDERDFEAEPSDVRSAALIEEVVRIPVLEAALVERDIGGAVRGSRDSIADSPRIGVPGQRRHGNVCVNPGRAVA